jgi:hypothetical protein
LVSSWETGALPSMSDSRSLRRGTGGLLKSFWDVGGLKVVNRSTFSWKAMLASSSNAAYKQNNIFRIARIGRFISFTFQFLVIPRPSIHPTPVPLLYLLHIPNSARLGPLKILKLIKLHALPTLHIHTIRLGDPPLNDLTTAQITQITDIGVGEEERRVMIIMKRLEAGEVCCERFRAR